MSWFRDIRDEFLGQFGAGLQDGTGPSGGGLSITPAADYQLYYGPRPGPKPKAARPDLTISGSAFGMPIPYIYGTRRVAGQLIAAHLYLDTLLNLVYVISEGELSSVSNIKLDDIAEASFGGNTVSQSYVGAPSQTIDSTLNTRIPDWSDTHNAGLVSVTGRSTGRAYYWVSLNAATNTSIPNMTCDVTRGSIDDWSSTSRASTNPVVALWDYMSTHLGITSGEIDSTSWDAVRSWCDEDPGDGTARWSINIALQGASDGDNINTILKHFFGKLSWYDGKFYLSARRTLSSATLEVGQDEIIDSLTWSRTPLHERPNYVDVSYTDATSGQKQKKTDAASGINRNSATCRMVEIDLPGCTDPSMAARYAEQFRLLSSEEVLHARFSVKPDAIKLNPGDRVDVTTPTGLSDTQFWISKITAQPDGRYWLDCTSYESTAQSATTDTGDTPPSTTLPPGNLDPATPTATQCNKVTDKVVDPWGNVADGGIKFYMVWTHGSGGDDIAGWAFETRDSTDPDPDSTITRSSDVFWKPEAVDVSFADEWVGQGINFPNLPWPSIDSGWGYDEFRVVAIGEHGTEAESSWVNRTSSTTLTSQSNGFLNLDDNDETTYTGNAGKIIRVNSTPDGVEFAAAAGIDTDAVHDNVAGEIDALTNVDPTPSDKILLEDQSDSWNKKETDFSQIGMGLGGPIRSDHNSDSQIRRYHSAIDFRYGSSNTGAFLIRPFGAAAAPANTMLHVCIHGYWWDSTGSTFNESGAVDVLIGGYAKTDPVWAVDGSSADLRGPCPITQVRLSRDASGYHTIVLGGTTDSWPYWTGSIDIISMFAGGDDFDPADITLAFDSSLTSFTHDVNMTGL